MPSIMQECENNKIRRGVRFFSHPFEIVSSAQSRGFSCSPHTSDWSQSALPGRGCPPILPPHDGEVYGGKAVSAWSSGASSVESVRATAEDAAGFAIPRRLCRRLTPQTPVHQSLQAVQTLPVSPLMAPMLCLCLTLENSAAVASVAAVSSVPPRATWCCTWLKLASILPSLVFKLLAGINFV